MGGGGRNICENGYVVSPCELCKLVEKKETVILIASDYINEIIQQIEQMNLMKMAAVCTWFSFRIAVYFHFRDELFNEKFKENYLLEIHLNKVYWKCFYIHGFMSNKIGFFNIAAYEQAVHIIPVSYTHLQLLHMGISEDRIIFDYVSSVKRIYVKDLLNMQRNNKGRFNHTDIIVKYNVIKSDIERTLCNADNLYMEMQRKKLHISDDEAETRLQAFRKLYRSVGRKWDASSGTIVCDTKLQIMEGAHQLACCLYYHQPIVNVRVVPGKTSTDYSLSLIHI